VILSLIFIVRCSYHHTLHTADAIKRKARRKKDNKERESEKERQKEVSFRRSRWGKITTRGLTQDNVPLRGTVNVVMNIEFRKWGRNYGQAACPSAYNESHCSEEFVTNQWIVLEKWLSADPNTTQDRVLSVISQHIYWSHITYEMKT
jgi:hypothetical protein